MKLFRANLFSVIVFIFLVILSAEYSRAGEQLYNDIVLPDEWPPYFQTERLRSLEPMEVPYLKNRPEVVPIDVGRQLFVDDFLVEKSTLTRQFYKAQWYEGNPVLKPETQGEKTGTWGPNASPTSDGVFYDPADKIFKMWYFGGDSVSFVTSKDGKHWERPQLDVFPGTNIVALAATRDSSTVWLDLEEKNPEKRYKMFFFHRDPWRASICYSADGIHWSKLIWTGPCWDRTTFFYNPFRKVWVYSIRDQLIDGPSNYKAVPPKQCERARRYWECKDFVEGSQWKGGKYNGFMWDRGQPVWWTAADRLDCPDAGPNDIKAELYNVDAVGYESIMLGAFAVYAPASRKGTKDCEVRFGFSRDGFYWDRPFREAVLCESDDSNAWNFHNVQSAGGVCLIVKDKLYFYCAGRKKGMSSTGLAFMRRDGFASMDASKEAGTLTTRSVTFKGKYMFVNADCNSGELLVEVLDKDSKVIEPFTKENCMPVNVDKTLLPVVWKGAADLSKISGQVVRFRFYLKNGSLYSFWVSPDKSGASYGYVAAGGPGFTSNRDTVGAAVYSAE